MRKIFLSEEQFKALVKRELNESISFVGGGMDEAGSKEKGGTATSKANVSSVIDYLNDLYHSEDGDRAELRGNLRDLAAINSVNFDYNQDERDELVRKTIEGKNEAVKNWVTKYLPTLRQCWNGNTFNASKETAKYDSKTKTIKNTRTKYRQIKDDEGNVVQDAYDKLDLDTRKNVVRLAAFLNKCGLASIYRDYKVPASANYACGLDLSKVGVYTPISYLEEHLNFSGLFDSSYEGKQSELDREYKGSKVDTLKKTLGRNPTEDEIEKFKLEQFSLKRAKRYIDLTYGVNLDFGKDNDMFKLGNNKIHNDTLVVNFTSATRCPAWNECIMKDACYAKTAETNWDPSLYANLKKDLIWRQTEKDPTLMKLMLGVLRSYLFNYTSLPAVRMAKGSENKQQLAMEMSRMTLDELEKKYGEGTKNILAKNKRGTLIRLNENGDFIGQWLVDAFEDFANELKPVGIRITAYTCRALNYESVKTMILNISQKALVDKQHSSAFAHFFYAIDPIDYQRLGETYGGPGYSLVVNEDQKITPVYRKLVDDDGVLKGYYYKCPCGRGGFGYVPYFKKNDTDANVTAAVVHGIDYDENSGMFYGGTVFMGKHVDASVFTAPKGYKFSFIVDADRDVCYKKNGAYNTYSPVNEDYNNVSFGKGIPQDITSNSTELYINIDDGQVYRKKSTGRKEGTADCYMCRICYARDGNDVRYEGGAKEGNLPVYVFVATHGANKDEFQTPASRKIEGKFPKEWADTLSKGVQQKSVAQNAVNEGVEQERGIDRLAIQGVTRNIIWSVSNHMRSLTERINEVKSKFNDFLERLNG